VVRREVVAAKAGRARRWLNDAAVALAGPLDAFVTDVNGCDLALFYLFRVPSSVHRVCRRPFTRNDFKSSCRCDSEEGWRKGGDPPGPRPPSH
jgi:hypothetical protein